MLNDIQKAAIAAARAISLPEILTVRDVAQALQLSLRAARGHIAAGRIPGRRVGRKWVVTRSALLEAVRPFESIDRLVRD